MQESDLYSVLGEHGFRSLIAAFYRQIPDDDILGPLYPPSDLAGAEKRLCDFLIFRFGGPQTYIEDRGHPRLRIRHAPFPVDLAARNRWMQLMNNALEETGVLPEPKEILLAYFESTATAMLNRPR